MMSPERTAVVADGQIAQLEFVADDAVKYNTSSMQARLEGKCAFPR